MRTGCGNPLIDIANSAEIGERSSLAHSGGLERGRVNQNAKFSYRIRVCTSRLRIRIEELISDWANERDKRPASQPCIVSNQQALHGSNSRSGESEMSDFA